MPVCIPPRGDQPKGYNKDDEKVNLIRLQNIIKQKLEEADTNKDGCYTKEELHVALKNLGAILPEWRANRCLLKADSNDDGQIGDKEVDTLVKYLISRGYGK